MNMSIWREQNPQTRPLAVEQSREKRFEHRTLPFQGAHNFRDMGGYKNTDGQVVKWGKLYRSDRLSDITDDDLQFINRLSLRHIVDLRSKGERMSSPSRTTDHKTIVTQLIPIFEEATSVDDLWREISAGRLLGKNLHDAMVNANRNFIRLHNDAFRTFMEFIAVEENAPLMFHCMAGKDRTGFGAAVILTLLGVPFETVMEDYLLTNTNLAVNAQARYEDMKRRTKATASFENLKPILGVHEDYLITAFATIDADYGSFDDYLRQGLQLSDAQIDAMRAHYLESL